jgi:hypothetical protein
MATVSPPWAATASKLFLSAPASRSDIYEMADLCGHDVRPKRLPPDWLEPTDASSPLLFGCRKADIALGIRIGLICPGPLPVPALVRERTAPDRSSGIALAE